jgi:hypothetical protein
MALSRSSFPGNLYGVLAQYALVPVPSLCEQQPSVSLAVEQVVQHALAKEPQQHFPSVKEENEEKRPAGTVTGEVMRYFCMAALTFYEKNVSGSLPDLK